MNNLKKIGLTALAASLVSTSVFAGEMSVAGSASLTVENYSGERIAAGKAFSMGNQLTFSGSGELDNGMNVSMSFVLDQGDDKNTVAGTAAAPVGGGSPFDSHSVTISSDAIGTVVFHGEGGDSAQNAVGDTAAGNIWDNFDGQQTGAATLAESDATNNMIHYTLPSIVDGLTLAASYMPQGSDDESQTAYGITYTGLVDGLTLKFGKGDDNDGTGGLSNAEATNYGATYAYGPMTFAYSDHNYDHETVTSSQDATSMKLSYTVSDAISVSYGTEEINSKATAAVQDAEYSKISASYTSGGMTVTVTSQEADNMNYTTTSTMDQDYWSLGLSFAF
jgi:outer membrane protein OmpU